MLAWVLAWVLGLALTAGGRVAPIVGHVGDGNFHCICAFMDEELEQVKELANSLSRCV